MVESYSYWAYVRLSFYFGFCGVVGFLRLVAEFLCSPLALLGWGVYRLGFRFPAKPQSPYQQHFQILELYESGQLVTTTIRFDYDFELKKAQP